MIEPLLADDALFADVQSGMHIAEGFRLWWLGQSGFLIQHDGRHLLFDPYLSESLTKKYAATDKPHARMTRRCIAPGRLHFVDVVTSSHNHTDHLDAETLEPLLAPPSNARLVVGGANREFAAARLHCPPESLTTIDAGEEVEIAGFVLHAVPSAHELLEVDLQGRCLYLGIVARFGGFTVYHSGDTVRFSGLAELLRPFAVDVALLPINGRKPERRVAGNLSGAEAAQLAFDIGAKLAIPCHYEMFEFNTEPPDEFVAACDRLGQPHRVLKCGERFERRA